ncbi:MAG: ubiquitin-like protein Pup [Bifidobacteriaceae bacterium]|nr:ubiquitin-like protein Pup [Bifidobacteriaceae bacterium]
MPQEQESRKHAITEGTAAQEQKSEQKATEASTGYSDLATGLDSVLDDIESVLEDNAEEYVNHFVQKGGE